MTFRKGTFLLVDLECQSASKFGQYTDLHPQPGIGPESLAGSQLSTLLTSVDRALQTNYSSLKSLELESTNLTTYLADLIRLISEKDPSFLNIDYKADNNTGTWKKMNLADTKVAFIGGGNMAQAIGAGLITKGILKPENIWVSAKTEKTLEYWKNLGTNTSLNSAECVGPCSVVFLAFKPHMLDEALHFVRTEKVEAKRRLFISVLAGVTLKTLRAKLMRFGQFAVIRTMPNTPLLIGSGITVYCGDSLTLPDDYSQVHGMFSNLGTVEQVQEYQMNAIGALSGSGPAYGYQIIEALSDGAVMIGVPRAMATKFAAQVLIGAAKMVLETGRHPGQLKDEVCSPGGTTIAGVHEMEDGGVRASLMNAIKAAFERCEELAEQSEDS